MINSKFFKVIWGINGILLLIVLILGSIVVLKEVYNSLNKGDYRNNRGPIVGNIAELSKEIDFDLQHLMYDSPQKIKNSDYFLIEIIVLDKELSTEMKDAIAKANDFSVRMIGAPVNVVFYNFNRSDIHKLLDTYGFIKTIDYPREYSYRYSHGEEKYEREFILYELAFRDTNADGRINDKDSTAFFLSDLAGKNLKQITPFSLIFDKYSFSNDYNEIYFEILEKHKDKDILGHKLKSRKIHFYNVKTGKLDKFKELDKMLSSVKDNFKL